MFYEFTYIVPATTEETQQKSIKEKALGTITEHKGKIITEPPAEKRKLSYIIKRTRQGVFQCIRFSAEKDLVPKINKDIKLIPDILRFQIIKVEEKKRTESKPRTIKKSAVAKKVTPKPKKEEPVVAKETAPAQIEDAPTPEKTDEKADTTSDKVQLDKLDEKIDKILEGDILK